MRHLYFPFLYLFSCTIVLGAMHASTCFGTHRELLQHLLYCYMYQLRCQKKHQIHVKLNLVNKNLMSLASEELLKYVSQNVCIYNYLLLHYKCYDISQNI